ncbi:MAG: ATP-dependent zinc protease [Calothrix sp. SM1_5_4]|nr:ATP-dependent zinc protease [Calothrix sp. SM1_5_4]
MKRDRLKTIGWREIVSLPELGVDAIKVKVDSGARTCALHATNIRYLRKSGGETWVSFLVHHAPGKKKRARAPLVEQRKVKSSLGHATIRPVIRTAIRLGGSVWSAEVTLVNRDPMGFRMLIGRRALRGRFLIHPGRSFLQSRERDDL